MMAGNETNFNVLVKEIADCVAFHIDEEYRLAKRRLIDDLTETIRTNYRLLSTRPKGDIDSIKNILGQEAIRLFDGEVKSAMETIQKSLEYICLGISLTSRQQLSQSGATIGMGQSSTYKPLIHTNSFYNQQKFTNQPYPTSNSQVLTQATQQTSQDESFSLSKAVEIKRQQLQYPTKPEKPTLNQEPEAEEDWEDDEEGIEMYTNAKITPTQYDESQELTMEVDDGIKYTVTVIERISGEAQDLVRQMIDFVAKLRPENSSGPVELIREQRSDQWFNERFKRVTASAFGVYVKRRSYEAEAVKRLVHTLLNPKKYGKIPALEYGVENEPKARQDYIAKSGNAVQDTGFWTHTDYPWLGGSPDGIVLDKSGQKGLLEIKCPYSAAQMTIDEYINKKGSYLIRMDDKIVLDKKHNYYYQIQGCLFLLGLKWCDFCVRTEKDIFIERIERNDTFISSMVAKLGEFYVRCLLPSLATNSYKKENIEYKILSAEAYGSGFNKVLEQAKQ